MERLSQLEQDWRIFNAAKQALHAADNVEWPTDPLITDVQASGLRFCLTWNLTSPVVSAIVKGDADLFPEFVGDKENDPRSYSNHHLIMPRLFME